MQTSDAKRYYLNPNCFEKTEVRWGIFKKLSFTNVDLEHVRPLATNLFIYAITFTKIFFV